MNKAVGFTIRARRKRLGIKQVRLAKSIGLSPKTLCGIEKGQFYPSLRTYFAINRKLAKMEAKSNGGKLG